MYKIKRTEYGLHIYYSGIMSVSEAKNWYNDIIVTLENRQGSFSIFHDKSNFKPTSFKVQEIFNSGSILMRKSGMERSIVILSNPVAVMQYKQFALDSGIYKWERYLDITTEHNWKKAGIDWLVHGINPEKSFINFNEGLHLRY